MRVPQLVLVVVLALSVGACAKARVPTELVMPVLAPPPPPPRVVETYADEPVPTIAPSPVDTALATPPVRPQPPTRSPEPPKPEPARAEPDRPANAAPALTLKPAPGAESKTEDSIRQLMGRAAADLQRVAYAALNADGRAQYDTARRFMTQAEEALKVGNLGFAGKLADKAATMASVLMR